MTTYEDGQTIQDGDTAIGRSGEIYHPFVAAETGVLCWGGSADPYDPVHDETDGRVRIRLVRRA
jgi:hypothetical protein